MSEWYFPGLLTRGATVSSTHHTKSVRFAQSKLTSNRSGTNTAPLSIKLRAWDSGAVAALSSLSPDVSSESSKPSWTLNITVTQNRIKILGIFLKQRTVLVHLKGMHEKLQSETWSKVLGNFISFHTAWLPGNSLPFLSDEVYKKKVTGHLFP